MSANPDQKVLLKVLHGKLENRRGDDAGIEVNIRKPRFVVGTSENCHMRCQGKSISDYHCEFLLHKGTVRVRDLESDSGTFVNDQEVNEHQLLSSGDIVRIGRLEFQIEITPLRSKQDAVSDFVSDLLVEADEEERAKRLQDPLARQFKVEEASNEPEQEESDVKKAPVRPARKPPGKLPPPPKYVADSTTEAAEDILKKIFDKPRG